jgi:hypothetical protein
MDDYFSMERSTDVPEVNVSNVNASVLLDVLGIQVGDLFEDRCCGWLPGEDFLGRVLVAASLSPVDTGIPAIRVGNVINCGRPEGYVNERLEMLRSVAEYAVAHRLGVSWA